MILFFHGLDSNPFGSKYQALKDAFGDVLSPDFENMSDLETRIEIAENITRGRTDFFVVGSSFGGLVAALLAHRYPERVSGYVLMAPAFHGYWSNIAQEAAHVPDKAVIIHGIEDDIVPIHASRVWADLHDVPLIEVHDNHRLENSLELMVEYVKRLR